MVPGPERYNIAVSSRSVLKDSATDSHDMMRPVRQFKGDSF